MVGASGAVFSIKIVAESTAAPILELSDGVTRT